MFSIQNIRKTVLMLVAGGFVWWAWKSSAQDTAMIAPPVLPYGVEQVLKLEQAKTSDDTIVAFINSSGYTYDLSDDQIVYLMQQGVSDSVLTAIMAPPTPAMAGDAEIQPDDTSTTIQPPVTNVQSAPIIYTDYYPYYPYYGNYGCFSFWIPRLVFNLASYGGGWHGGSVSHGSWGGNRHGGGWNNGWHGGTWNGGGTWHGGGGSSGGSWHGGGGGWHGSGSGGWHSSGGGGWHGGGGGGFHHH
jgi:hypothetical protein